MSLRPRLGEIVALTALLDAEHDDVESLAGAVFREASDLVAAREAWCVIVAQPSETWVYGPFYSRNSAEKAVLANAFEVRGEARFLVRRMINDRAGGSADD